MEISVIILCLLLSAFFSGMEIAFISSNRIYLGIEKMQETLVSRALVKITEKPSRFIVTMLLGNTVALVVYGFYMGRVLVKVFANLGFQFGGLGDILLQTFLSTLVILITSEFLPKVFFRIYANKLVKVLALPAYFFYMLFYYISGFIITMSDFILKHIFGSSGDKEQEFFSRAELGDYISEQLNASESTEKVDFEIQIFQNALEFSGVKARDVMTPRTEISGVEVHDPVEKLKALFIETDYSKVLVYQNSIDDIIGYVHSFDLFKKPKTIKAAVIPVEFVPETILIKDIMDLLTRKRRSVAVVLDEYGGTAGIVTIEDIVEELFGEIEDEHDAGEEYTEKQLDDNTWLFSARLDV
ncbi:MAG: HlyC/CorC family transporter, partial [Chitinophagaceae bacterium]